MGLGRRMIDVKALPVRRRTWMQTANIPRARLGWEFEDCKDVHAEDLEKLKVWIEQVRKGNVIRADGKRSCGKGLLISGEPGNGKTTLALTVIQEMLRTFPLESFDGSMTMVRPCYFLTFNDVLDLKGKTMDDPSPDDEVLFSGLLGDCKDDAYNIRVLVVDDIGKEHMSTSGWQKNMLHHLLRTRFNNGLPTVVTTNIKLDAWDTLYGTATESFAMEAFAHFILKSTRGDLRR